MYNSMTISSNKARTEEQMGSTLYTCVLRRTAACGFTLQSLGTRLTAGPLNQGIVLPVGGGVGGGGYYVLFLFLLLFVLLCFCLFFLIVKLELLPPESGH